MEINSPSPQGPRRHKKLLSGPTLLILLVLGGFTAFAYSTSLFGFNPMPFAQEGGNVPLPGTWDFKLGGLTGGSVGCLGMSGIPTLGEGEATLNVSATGGVVNLNLSGQGLTFNQYPGGGVYLYKTHTYNFPVMTPEGDPHTGTVRFEMVANTTESIIGTLFWDNRLDCAAQYPFSLTLNEVDLSVIPPYELVEGTWNIEYGEPESTCESEIATFGNLPQSGLVDVVHPYDLDTGEIIPGEIHLEGSNHDFYFEGINETNNYSNLTEIEVGIPENADGEVLLDYENDTFTGTYEGLAGSETNMEGTLYVGGPGGCTFNIPFSMNYMPPIS